MIWDGLRQALGELVDDGPERYSFSWAGKRDAIRMLQVASHTTLVPDREEAVNFEETANIFIEGENVEGASRCGRHSQHIFGWAEYSWP